MSLQRGPKNENNTGAAWAVFRTVDSLHSSGTWDYHLGRSEEEMKELEIPCKTCMHNNVCSHLPYTVNIIENINTDINSGNYQANIVLHLSCTEYVREAAVPRNEPDTYF